MSIKIFKNFICLICLLLLFVSCDNTNKKNFILAKDYEQEKEYVKALSIYRDIILFDEIDNKYKKEAIDGYIRNLKEINDYYNRTIDYYESNKHIKEIEIFGNDIDKIKDFSLTINNILKNENYFKDNFNSIFLVLKEIDLKAQNINKQINEIIKQKEKIIWEKENYIRENIDKYKVLIKLYEQAKTSQKANKFKPTIQDIKNTINKINKESSLTKQESIINNTNKKYNIEKIEFELNDIINYKKNHLLGDGYKNLKWGMSKQQVKSLIKKPIVEYSKDHLIFRLDNRDFSRLMCVFVANKLFFVKLQIYTPANGFSVQTGKDLEVANIVREELNNKFSDAKTFDTSSQVNFIVNEDYERNAQLVESLAFEDNYSKIIFCRYEHSYEKTYILGVYFDYYYIGTKVEVLYFSKSLSGEYLEKEEMLEEQKRQKEEERERNRVNKQTRNIQNLL